MSIDEHGLQVGAVIGGYELDRCIGKGGMAEVWVARKARSRAGKFVAIKVILPHLAGQERYSRMFRHEADLSSMLNHSNIVQVFDEGEDNGISYLVMEYVDGINLVRLREALRLIDDATVRESIVAHVIGQLLHALSYAHSITTHEGEDLRIVHRDVSPQNVLVSNSGDIKLADFGVAHTVIEESSGVHIKGKLRYMAPEQLGGRTKEPAIDLYAAGAILHELLEGVKFRGEFDDDRVLYSQILSGAMPKLSRPCAPELDRVRQALLAGEPAQRVKTADEALALLREFKGYRDMRLEVSRICASLTGVARPRTGPGLSSRLTPTPEAGRSAPVASAPIAPASVMPEPTAHFDGAPSPPYGGAPAEPTAYLDGAWSQPAEPTTYLAGGGLPAAAAPPIARPEATDTENRPRPVTIPDRMLPAHAVEDEMSMTRFPVRKRSKGGLVAMLSIGIVLALGGATATGWWLTRTTDDTPERVAKRVDPPAKPATEPAKATVPVEAAPDLVIGDDAKADAPEPTPAKADPVEEKPAVAEDPAPEEPIAEPDAPAATPAAPAGGRKNNTTRGSRSGTHRNSAASPAEPAAASGPAVLVHFRKDGVAKAWVKIAGRSFEIEGGTNRKIPSGNQRVYKKLAEDGGFASCGRFEFAPGREWIVYVGTGSCRMQSLGG